MSPVRDARRDAAWLWLSCVCALAVLVSIWWPEYRHYHRPVGAVDPAAVAALRTTPADAVLDEIAPMRTLHPARAAVSREQAIADGEAALRGEFVLVDGRRIRFGWPFDPASLTSGPAEWALAAAAFAIPDRLLGAYEATRDDRYLDAALDYLERWLAWDEGTLLPPGLAANDHATAERVFVAVDLWRAYRHHPRYDPARGERIARLVRRDAELLARPEHFTFATNHGVMQNLALLHVGVAMPALPDADALFRTGRDRLVRQLGFYLSPEGVVLEHSAGYHAFGLHLLRAAQRYFALAGVPPPPELPLRIERASAFLAALRRPDGSLPPFGDTHVQQRSPGAHRRDDPLAAAAPPRDACIVNPVSGYAVWWGVQPLPPAGSPAQLVALWSNFPGHGHKHADDLALLYWADGQEWLSAAGYWSYDHPGRPYAESWRGANAPHAAGESPRGERESRLLGSACAGPSAMVDLERVSAAGLRVRRQVLQVSPETFVVIDSADGTVPGPIETSWTTFPGLVLTDGPSPSQFRLARPAGGATLDVAFAGSPPPEIRPVRVVADPPGGRVFVDARPMNAPVLEVRQRGMPARTATVFTLNATGADAAIRAPPELAWRSATSWTLSVPLSGGRRVVARENAEVEVDGLPILRLAATSAETAAERRRIESAYRALAADFPRFRDLARYRARATWALVGVLVLQLCLAVAPVPALRARRRALGAGFACAYLLFGLWLHLYYFAH